MSDNPEIYPCTTQIKRPGPGFPSGQVAFGAYTLVDGVVTLVHPQTGVPVRDANGKQYSCKLTAEEDSRTVAGVLTREFRLALLGKTKENERFSRPIVYKNSGIA